MDSIEKLKVFNMLINIYIGFLIFTLVTLSMFFLLFLYVRLFGIVLLYCFFIWVFLLGVCGLLMSLADDYKWSLFNLDCKLKKKAASLINFQVWLKENDLLKKR